MTVISVVVSFLLFYSAFETIDILDPNSVVISILLLDAALILFICTMVTSSSKIIADSVGFAFAKKNIQRTNSGAEFFLRELTEQIPLVIFPTSIAAFCISHALFNSSGTESALSAAIGLLIVLLTIVACTTKAVSDGIVTGLLNAGALKMFSAIDNDDNIKKRDKKNTTTDSEGYEWYENNGKSYYRVAGTNGEWTEFRD